MSAENQTSLSFSLNEAIWFQRGQEVADLLSIELHPQVGVQEYSDYIQVKGSLELYGEYYAKPAGEMASLRETGHVRTAQEVYEREDGIYVLTHLFPLDVTIPRSRIQEVEDVYVQIESFDYDLTEDNELRILADLSIQGLAEQEVQQPMESAFVPFEPLDTPPEITRFEEVRVEAEEVQNMPASEHYFEPFQFEMRKMPTEEDLEEQMEQEKLKEKEEMDTFLQPQVEYFSRQDASYKHTLDEGKEGEVKMEAVEQEEEEEVREKVPNRPENALYLTKLFQRNSENEFRKMRMYFVQNGDTLESIAEKYEVQTQQITRKNQLEDDFLFEGQLLYIPVRPSRPKA
ncbi:stage VI sporulation protein D [Priestia taiwanensis]|uniref:Stage VI sporulation protein D n=1 Tax=Priestia taiwanensis TaxID=1347902 RepID=A0A917ER70_9BACI|nr:stage VI sporulation protein D [Priestia taiwanensis]MBM7363583.1 stage VI sporulation protein D [Priestia taiwanensis]GGE75891.1 stage VI sporulation protein D [Priestia taiwanensis]